MPIRKRSGNFRGGRLQGGRRPRNAEGQPLAPKCAGETDPITLDEIDEANAIRILENGHYFCFDINGLFNQFHSTNSAIRYLNPTTRAPFSAANIAKIQRKFAKMNLFPSAMNVDLPAAAYMPIDRVEQLFKPIIQRCLDEGGIRGLYLMKIENVPQQTLGIGQFSVLTIERPQDMKGFFVLNNECLVLVPENRNDFLRLLNFLFQEYFPNGSDEETNSYLFFDV